MSASKFTEMQLMNELRSAGLIALVRCTVCNGAGPTVSLCADDPGCAAFVCESCLKRALMLFVGADAGKEDVP